MESFIKDLKHSLRMFVQSPAFTLAAVAALTLGIGANTAIFSVVNAVLLKPVALPDADRVRLDALERELDEREAELQGAKAELQELQNRYLREIGGFYATLTSLEAALIEAEIAAGLRPPVDPEAPLPDEADAADDAGVATGCSNRSAPSDDLKRVFRDLAKAIHPDLARDESARYRRHSLMAEANRAYAERDEDRLRLIMRAFERDPHAAVDEGVSGDDGARRRRRMSDIEERLVRIQAELADLRASAIWRLRSRIDEARQQGWDLFAEMILQVKSEIARATARLSALQRSGPTSPNR